MHRAITTMCISTTSASRQSKLVSALGTLARALVAAGLLLLALVPSANAHTDLELQIETLSQQIEVKPTDVDLRLKRGDLYRRHLDFERAAEDFSAARRIEPANPQVNFYQGRLALETGNAVEAQAYLSRYLEHDPDHAAAWVMLGRAELSVNTAARAANSFANAIQSSTTPSPELYRLLALALVADQRADEGLEALERALMHWPGQVNLLGLACDIALAENLPERAENYLQELPEQLLTIDRWRECVERAACLSNTDTDQTDRIDCLEASRRDIEEQVELVMATN